MVAVASCSGVAPQAGWLDGSDLAAHLARSPCGGGDFSLSTPEAVSDLSAGFEAWPLPQVYVSAEPLDDDAVACFDGVIIVVDRRYHDDRVIHAHEFCHAITFLEGQPTPPSFPLPEPVSPHARALTTEIWEQEIWAVTCSTAVTGLRDWSWGGLVDDTTPQALEWARTFVIDGPSTAVQPPPSWSTASE
jgi:hypothetical protein